MSNDYIPQSSASDRYDAARKALAEWDNGGVPGVRAAHDLAEVLRALITPPGVHESEEQIAVRILEKLVSDEPFIAAIIGGANLTRHVKALVAEGVRAGIQAAHETWECEDRPTQEQMLRWLGIEYDNRYNEAGYEDGYLIIEQFIEREDD